MNTTTILSISARARTTQEGQLLCCHVPKKGEPQCERTGDDDGESGRARGGRTKLVDDLPGCASSHACTENKSVRSDDSPTRGHSRAPREVREAWTRGREARVKRTRFGRTGKRGLEGGLVKSRCADGGRVVVVRGHRQETCVRRAREVVSQHRSSTIGGPRTDRDTVHLKRAASPVMSVCVLCVSIRSCAILFRVSRDTKAVLSLRARHQARLTPDCRCGPME